MDFVAANQSGTGPFPQLNILVVDDDILNQRMMKVLLTREGHQVDTVSNGLEALASVKIKTYDIVFMDLQMPGMDGIEASHLIRQWENGGHHTFIVALTASYLPEKGQTLFDAGIDNYIAKPFELEHIQRLLNYSIKAGLVGRSERPTHVAGELPSEEILDIQKGIEQVGGDIEAYKELLGDFAAGLPERLQAIQQFFKDMDLIELARAAHNLTGIAANLGALQLSEYAKRLDKESGEGYTASVAPLLEEIQLTVGKLLETANDFLAEKKIRVESV